ncbi:MAG: hypothetical protein JWQ09_5506 [Segetibacter sp.]|nr:hypothetical protein [Segetibacter sp.]
MLLHDDEETPEQGEGFWSAAGKFATGLLDAVDTASTAMVCVPNPYVMGVGAGIKTSLYGGRAIAWGSGKAATFVKSIPWSKVTAHITKTAAAIGRKLP